jgi:hypothetical protein
VAVSNSPCQLNISLTGGVFDLYKNTAVGAALVTGATQNSQSIPLFSSDTYYIHVYDQSPGPIQTHPFTLNLSTSAPTAGSPNNTSGNPVNLTPLSCQTPMNLQTDGTTANDGSNAWYTVRVTGLPLTSCTLNISLTTPFGGVPAVFDLYKNSATSPALVTGATQMSQPIPLFSSDTYYIHVYDLSIGPITTGPFTLHLIAQ